MKIEQIQSDWQSDCKIDDDHLDKASMHTPNLHQKYLSLLIPAKLKLAQFNHEYNTTRKNKFRYYRGEMTQEELTAANLEQWQGAKPLRAEMDEFLIGDTELSSLKLKIEYFNTMIYQLESILTAIRARDWQIKNSISYKQFIAGM